MPMLFISLSFSLHFREAVARGHITPATGHDAIFRRRLRRRIAAGRASRASASLLAVYRHRRLDAMRHYDAQEACDTAFSPAAAAGPLRAALGHDEEMLAIDITAAMLHIAGIPPALLQCVPSRHSSRHPREITLPCPHRLDDYRAMPPVDTYDALLRRLPLAEQSHITATPFISFSGIADAQLFPRSSRVL